MLLHRESVEGDLGIQVAFTDSSLDLGDRGPDPAADLGRLGERLGVVPVIMRQVHGREVYDASSPPAAPPVADALISTAPGVALLARAADCVPVLLADCTAGVIGAVHAGRHGVLLDVVGAAVAAMRDAGASRIEAWIGPHVCGRCYEVPDTMRAEVGERWPTTWTSTRQGTPGLDLGAGVVAQLEAAGVTVIHDVGVCTLEDDRFPSHRRGDSARFAGVIWR